MPRLFHVSDVSGIQVFEPRMSRTGEALVWAIEESKLANYLLPRDCPRVTFYSHQATSDQDKKRFLGSSKAVIAIESGWLAKCLEARLYIYEFDPKNFSLQDEIAGYYVSTQLEYPLCETPVENCLIRLLEAEVELTITAIIMGIARSGD